MKFAAILKNIGRLQMMQEYLLNKLTNEEFLICTSFWFELLVKPILFILMPYVMQSSFFYLYCYRYVSISGGELLWKHKYLYLCCKWDTHFWLHGLMSSTSWTNQRALTAEKYSVLKKTDRYFNDNNINLNNYFNKNVKNMTPKHNNIL